MTGERERFAFGRNWRRFLADLNDDRIRRAEQSLADLLGTSDLTGRTFLDVGSGSGLFSLAARRMGARVRSFDLDPQSVACTAELRERFFPSDAMWAVERGSALDDAYLGGLGQFDMVYAWGVLHHTGAMWRAVENVLRLVAPGGRLVLALYNDQGRTTVRWRRIKRLYNRLPRALRFLVLGPAFLRLWGPTTVRDLLRGRPGRTWRTYAETSRGMSPWRDALDWVGGYPFEAARPEAVLDFCRQRGFLAAAVKTVGAGRACNEFVLRRNDA
jgi:2-polyprenyl-3-methyl-5-hydroxy-6-metoxy-1,4-benzoquinol methylase